MEKKDGLLHQELKNIYAVQENVWVNIIAKKYSKKVTLICPICGKEYDCKQSKINHHRTCGNKECSTEWLKRTKTGKSNGNYKSYADDLKKLSVSTSDKHIYQHIVKEILGLRTVN